MLQNRSNLFLIFFIFIFGSFGCVAHDSLHIRTLYGSEIEQYIPQIVDSCLSVYREYPEFYDGTIEEYQPIIEKYVRSSFGVATLLFDNDHVVGLAIGAPLEAKKSEYDEAILKQHSINPQQFFYIAEWVVLPEYRDNGYGKQLFETLVKTIQESKQFPYICLLSTEAPENYPKPDRCFPKNSFFERQGFIRRELVIDLPWKDIQTQEVISHSMSVWVKVFDVELSELQTRILRGTEINPYVSNIVEMVLEIFQEYPDLYEGSKEEYEPIIKGYAQSPDGLAICCFDNGKLVGCIIGGPLSLEHFKPYKDLFEKNNVDMRETYYLSEWMIAKNYRNKGYGKLLFQQFIQGIKELHKYPYICLLSTDEPKDQTITRPNNYFSRAPFFEQEGFIRKKYSITVPWKDIIKHEVIDHSMSVWVKDMYEKNNENI